MCCLDGLCFGEAKDLGKILLETQVLVVSGGTGSGPSTAGGDLLLKDRQDDAAAAVPAGRLAFRGCLSHCGDAAAAHRSPGGGGACGLGAEGGAGEERGI